MIGDIIASTQWWVSLGALFASALVYGIVHDVRQRRRHRAASPRRHARAARRRSS
ncbi:hypothetical protein ABMA10_00475 [Plantibacter sp. RU18]